MQKTSGRVARVVLVLVFLGAGMGALALLRTASGEAEMGPQVVTSSPVPVKDVSKQAGPGATPCPPRCPPAPPAPIAGPASLVRERSTAETLLKARTVEELLNTAEDLKAKRADLERQEQELTAELREKLREQRERLRRHGITLSRCAGKSEEEVTTKNTKNTK